MVEKLFIFNLDALSMVLYRRRSFETTVKIRLITGNRRLTLGKADLEDIFSGFVSMELGPRPDRKSVV